MSELSSESTDDRFMHSEPLDHELSNDSSNTNQSINIS